ncbi:hypothetical protein N8I77_003854 [Diaporthe amygdali]|uniref:Uncharacterized protein n=1 Tax=Phomopsis amygdali TaxID=1214568 RepID=A0AAD9SL96_PHOAM|nr:hypothetical protein N8I77_003854 [Diaporthe amygdali]
MCWYKRVIFSDNHSKLAGLVRKCHLQLAFENTETTSGCGTVNFHSMQSLKVQNICPDCTVRRNKEADMLATIKEQLAQAKTKLRLNTEYNDHGREVNELEAFSPLSVRFSGRKENEDFPLDGPAP